MLPADKPAHFLAGIAIAAMLLPFGFGPAFVGTLAAAVGKELWDAQGHGTPEKNDAIATVLGGVLLLGWHEIAAQWL